MTLLTFDTFSYKSSIFKLKHSLPVGKQTLSSIWIARSTGCFGSLGTSMIISVKVQEYTCNVLPVCKT